MGVSGSLGSSRDGLKVIDPADFERYVAVCLDKGKVAPAIGNFRQFNEAAIVERHLSLICDGDFKLKRRPHTHAKLFCKRFPQTHTHPTRFAGAPTNKACGGTSRVTIAPAPTIAHSPIVIPGRIVAFAPTVAPVWISVGKRSNSS